MNHQRRFQVDAGLSHLDVTLEGAEPDGLRELVERRLAAFVSRTTDPGDDDATLSAPQDASSSFDRDPGTARRRIACRVHVEDTEWLKPLGAETALAPVAARDGEMWRVAWPYYVGQVGGGFAALTICRREPALEHALRAAVIFNLLPGQLAFHAAALVWGGEGWLIAGSPGAGKSTMAREGGADRVISNEIAMLERQDAGWTLLPSPFWGTGDVARMSEPALLKGIAVLSQATQGNRWDHLAGAQGAAALMPHVAAQSAAQLHDGAILRDVAALAGAVPVFSLAWFRESHPLAGLRWKP